jgi:4-hydroxythreonine-4-phosphate dehydrogenase
MSMGDPAGVGPEVALKALASPEIQAICTPILFGDAAVLESVAQKLDLVMPEICIPYSEISRVGEQIKHAKSPILLDFELIDGSHFEPGMINAATGNASFQYFDAAIAAAKFNVVDAIVTGPINKEAINLAGFRYPGHTEILSEKFSVDDVCMMLTSDAITCSIVTTHVGYGEVPDLLSVDNIYSTIHLSHEALVKMRGREVRLCCCGLNPHAGENGLFGNDEEASIIIPALEKARANGIQIDGPLPADTAFRSERRKVTDGYICMYHDQGLIPLKALAFDDAVNVSLGLPIVRTSVDHGTACDIAWKGTASVSSMLEAIRLAVKLAN